MNIAAVDRVNLFLIFFSFFVAYLIPYELLLFSYAFLGPLHYLTEISWLHDRQYFTISRADPYYLMVGSVLIVIANFLIKGVSEFVWLLVLVSFCFAFIKSKIKRLLILTAGTTFFFYFTGSVYSYALAVLITSVVHVFLFTLLFMWFGAIKSGSRLGLFNAALFFVGGITLVFLPQSPIIIFPEYVANHYPFFSGISSALASLLQISSSKILPIIASFLAFSYTYHYLNWFSKTSIIEWHSVSKQRALLIAVLYLFSVGLYIYNYSLGFTALLVLSFMHVVLEFPLNFKSIEGIVKSLIHRNK